MKPVCWKCSHPIGWHPSGEYCRWVGCLECSCVLSAQRAKQPPPPALQAEAKETD